MSKICPYSMQGEPMECYREDCMAWNDGECSKFTREPLSGFFIAKNMKHIVDIMKRNKDERWNTMTD